MSFVPNPARAVLEELEPRILYSADLAAVTLAGSGGADPRVQEVRLVSSAQDTAASTAASAGEIAFVDLGVPDAQSLVAGLLAERAAGRPIEVVTIGTDEDGLAVISQTLAERHDISAVHVISHGEDGVVQLGAVQLDADSLMMRADEIAGWSHALQGQADILLYGCDVAATDAGLALIDGLAALSGADVAASTDLTGSAARGGDWVLERETGAIEAAPAADAALQQAWQGLLPTTEFQVNTTTAGTQTTDTEVRGSQQAVAMDAAGNFTVVWSSPNQDGDGQGVYARRYAADGTALGGEIQVNTTTNKDQMNARIVCDDAGNYTVAWTSKDQDVAGLSVYLRRFAADGTALTGEIRANATAAGTQDEPVMGINRTTGTLVVAWAGDGPLGSSVYFRRFDAAGTALDAADRPAISGTTTANETAPAVAMNRSGQFAISWSQGTKLLVQDFDATGARVGTAATVNYFLKTQGNSSASSVAMDDAGKYTVVYREETVKGIWFRQYSASGTAASPSMVASGDANEPSISMASDGTFIVTYEATKDGDKHGVYARPYAVSGAASAKAFVVNQYTTGEQRDASVAMLDAGHYVVVWSGEGSGDNTSVQASLTVPAPTPAAKLLPGATAPIQVSTPEDVQIVVDLQAVNSGGNAVSATYAITGGADAALFTIDAATGQLTSIGVPDYELPQDAGADNQYDVIAEATSAQGASTFTLAIQVSNGVEVVQAVADTAVTNTATAVTVPVLANDLPGDGTVLTVVDVSQPAHGKAGIVNNEVVYTSEPGYHGQDMLSYRALDGSEGVTHLWSLDGTATDSVGGLNGVMVNSPVATAGTWDQGLQFDGVDDRVSIDDLAYNREFTLSLWFRLDGNAGTGYNYLYSHGTPEVANSVNVFFIEASTVTTPGAQDVLRTTLLDGNDVYALGGLDIPAAGLTDNQWHQYTLTTETGVGSRVYVDGVLRASSANGGDAIDPLIASVVLGSRSDFAIDHLLAGALDDVVLLDHKVDAAGATALFNGVAAEASVAFTVNAVNNNAPVIGSNGGGATAAFGVPENTLAVTTVTATDPDGTALPTTYSIASGNDATQFNIDPTTGELAFVTAPDFEHPADANADGVYDVVVRASDGTLSSIQALAVTVTNVFEPVQATADSASTPAQTTVSIPVLANDHPGDGSTLQVLDVSQPAHGTATIVANQVSYTPATGYVGSDSLNYRVLDGSEGVTHAWSLNGNAADPVGGATGTLQYGPTAVAGVWNQGLKFDGVDDRVTLPDVTYTSDFTLSLWFRLDSNAGPDLRYLYNHGSTNTANSLNVYFTGESNPTGGQNVLRTALRDSNDLTASTGPDTYALDTSAAGLADGQWHQYTLTVKAGSGSAVYVDGVLRITDLNRGGDAINPAGNVVLGTRSDAPSTRYFDGTLDDVTLFNHAVSATGAASLFSTSPVQAGIALTVTPTTSASPVIVSDGGLSTAVVSVDENTRMVTTVVATDADVPDQTLTYSITGGTDAALFTIDSVTGVLSFVTAPDHEAPTDANVNNLYLVVVQASDGVNTGSQGLIVDVLDVNEARVGAIADANPDADAVDENAEAGTAVGYVARAVDPDDTDDVTYSLGTTGTASDGLFFIGPWSGTVWTTRALNYEAAASYTIKVIATSTDGSTSTANVLIRVNDVNEASVGPVSDTNSAADVVPENSPAGTVVGYTAHAVDLDGSATVTYSLRPMGRPSDGLFAIDPQTGVITVAGVLDYETARSQMIRVVATSSDLSSNETDVIIGVTDVSEAPVGAISDNDTAADQVSENWPVGAYAGYTAHAVDPDGSDTVSYSLAPLGTASDGLFSIDAVTGAVKVAGAIDHESATSHTIRIVATSSDLSTSTADVVIAVRDVSEFNVGPVSDTNSAADVVPENSLAGTVVGYTAHAVDLDGSATVTYSLRPMGRPSDGLFAIDPQTGVITVAGVLDYETARSQMIRVVATSSDLSSNETDVIIGIADVSEAPVGAISDTDAADNQVSENWPVGAYAGYTAHAADPDGSDTVSYSLATTGTASDGLFSIDETTGAVKVAGAIDHESAASHTLRIVARSSDLTTSTADVVIAVKDVSEFNVGPVGDISPVANVVAEDAPVGTLTGYTARATDQDGSDVVSYSLSPLGTPSDALFAIDPVTGQIRVAGALDYESATSHILRVVATSTDGSWASAYITIMVVDRSEAPVGPVSDADATPDEVPENAPVDTPTGLVARAVDPDGTAVVRYSLLESASSALFRIDASTGVVTVAGALDAETTTSHTLTVQATSSDTSVSTRQFVITVRDANEYGVTVPVDTNPAANAVKSNALVGAVVGITARASDADVSLNAVTYTLADSADGRFAIDPDTGVVQLARSIQAEEGAASWSIVVQAASADGSVAQTGFDIAVLPSNDFAPVITSGGGGSTALLSVAENTTAVTTVTATDADLPADVLGYAITGGADAARFSIDATTGALQFIAAPDYEQSDNSDDDQDHDRRYEVTVQVSDGLRTDTQALSVLVTDVNEYNVGGITDQNPAAEVVGEDAAIGTLVGITAQATDQDASDTVTYSLADSADGRFAIDATSGVVRVAGPLDAEQATLHTIVVQATSSDTSVSLQRFEIAVQDVNEFDVSSVADQDAAPDTVREDAAIGTAVGITAQARDADIENHAITYTLDDAAGGRFAIDRETGVVTLARAIDDEAVAVRNIVVRATSSDGSSSTASFGIGIVAVNSQAPVITSDGGTPLAPLTVAENTTAVTTVTALDADLPADTLTYRIAGGADAARFGIDATTGALRFLQAPDFEAPADAGADNRYDVQVGASDGLHEVTQALAVAVTNVNEVPRVDMATLQVTEGGTAAPRLIAGDVDTAADQLQYRVEQITGGRFERVGAPDPTPAQTVTTFTQADVDAGLIRFVADGGEAAPAVRLGLSDGQLQAASADLSIDFTPVNDAPQAGVVDLGATPEDTPFEVSAQTLLQLGRATDTDSATLTVDRLRVTQGEVTLTQVAADRWRLTPQADWHGAVSLAFDVTDGQARVSTTAALDVTAVNDAPRITSQAGAASAELSLPEGRTDVTTVAAEDADGDVTLTYAISGGADAAAFSIDPSTGRLSFKTAPDFERPADAAARDRYEVLVSTSDGQVRVDQLLGVSVTDVNEAPAITRNVLVISTTGTATLSLQSSDPDTAAAALVYHVTEVQGGQFALAGAPNQPIQVFTQAQIDQAEVVFVAGKTTVRPAYVLTLTDGGSSVTGAAEVRQQVAEPMSLNLGTAAASTNAAADDGTADSDTRKAAPVSATASPAAAPDKPAMSSLDAGLGLGNGVTDNGVVDPVRPARTLDTPAPATPMSVRVPTPVLPSPTDILINLTLPSEDRMPSQDGALASLNLISTRSTEALAVQLDRLRTHVAEEHRHGVFALASTTLVSAGVSVGYVIWLVRGGVLMASLVSAVPAWAGMDPLPVLAQLRRGESDEVDSDETDPIERLFSKARRLLARTADEAVPPTAPSTHEADA